MANGAAPFTVEQERDQLFSDGSTLRTRIVEKLRNGQELRVTPKEAILRNRIANAEKLSRQLTNDFMSYNGRVTNFVQRLATTQNVQTPQGLQPLNLNTQFQFAIYISQLSTHREMIRSALGDYNELISSRRTQANAMLALLVSLASIFIALFLGIMNFMSR